MPTPASLITNETYDSGGVSRRSSRSLFSSIFSVLEPERFIGRRSSAELTAQTKSASEAWGKRSSPDDSALYHAFIRSNVTGWTVSVGAPRGVIDGSLLRGEALLASGGVIFLLLGFCAARVIGSRIADPIARLAASADAIQRGEGIDLKGSAVREAPMGHKSSIRQAKKNVQSVIGFLPDELHFFLV
jgi:hypothetical protein